jgi:hypothetical protein
LHYLENEVFIDACGLTIGKKKIWRFDQQTWAGENIDTKASVDRNRVETRADCSSQLPRRMSLSFGATGRHI